MLLCTAGAVAAGAQQAAGRGHAGVKGLTEPEEPAHPEPAATDFVDRKYGVAFHVPAGWNFERRDGVLSNFGSDVRTTRRNLQVRGVAAINYNPYPPTTFSGATFYYSVAPRSTAAACTAQATTGHLKASPDVRIAGVVFHHGQDQHGAVCTESRDDVFSTLSGNACLRFDLVVNTFCAQSSGAMEISDRQLGDVNTRLAQILGSIHIGVR